MIVQFAIAAVRGGRGEPESLPTQQNSGASSELVDLDFGSHLHPDSRLFLNFGPDVVGRKRLV